jgi:hypothetical protein
VQFGQDEIGAYVLARILLWKAPDTAAKDLQELVSHASSFSLGALVDFHEDDEEKTFKWLHDLLETSAIDQQRTALKAGPTT